jgi:hypothetical protein
VEPTKQHRKLPGGIGRAGATAHGGDFEKLGEVRAGKQQTTKEKIKMSTCPYFDQDYKKCNFYDTYQEAAQKENYCLTSDNWTRCANYEKSSYDQKVTKKLRPNPEL